MTYPLVQIVSRPALDAEVRFDCNSEDLSWPDADSFSIGAPSLLGDPGGVAAEYGLRTVSFNLAVQGDEALTLRKQVELARELMRDESYLMFQLSDSAAPMWFRLYRSSPGELSFATYFRDDVKQRWIISVGVAADPFAMGEQVTHSLTIGNDPATGGLVSVLPDIQGDAPAPLVLEVGAGWDYVFATAGLTRWDGQQVWQESSFSGGSVVADSGASGGNMRQRTPGSSWATAFSAAVAPPQAGRWRLLARMGSYVSGSGNVEFRAAGDSASDPVSATVIDSFGLLWWDLGIYSFPKGNIPLSADYEIQSPPPTDTVVIEARQTGSGRVLNLDCVLAIPVDVYEQVGSVFAQVSTSAADAAVIDGDQERCASLGGDGKLWPDAGPTLVGGFPKVFPGVTNVMHVVATNGDDVTGALNVTLKYHPRFLWLAS